MILRATAAGLFVTSIADAPVRLSIASALPENHTAIGIVCARFQDVIVRLIKDAGTGRVRRAWARLGDVPGDLADDWQDGERGPQIQGEDAPRAMDQQCCTQCSEPQPRQAKVVDLRHHRRCQRH